MKVSEVFGGFLEAEDLPEGKDVPVTIGAVRESTQDDKGSDGKPIDFFFLYKKIYYSFYLFVLKKNPFFIP